MSLTLQPSSTVDLNQESSASPMVSPCSDKSFWNDFNQRIETRKADQNNNVSEGSERLLKDNDSKMLINGFDSVAASLSLLTSNLQCALQGARELAKSSTPLTELTHNNDAISKTNSATMENNNELKENISSGDDKKGIKRKLDDQDCSNNQGGDQEVEISDNKKKQKHQTQLNQMKKNKNLTIAMATKLASLAKELNSVRYEMCFLQEKCALLEEKNQKLRDGFDGGARPDDDDLVRLQLEALLAEKSRLATENANLNRENQCLRQLVEYHQFASEDLSASYEQVIQGISLDFSSPTVRDDEDSLEDDPTTPTALREAYNFEFPTCLDKSFAE